MDAKLDHVLHLLNALVQRRPDGGTTKEGWPNNDHFFTDGQPMSSLAWLLSAWIRLQSRVYYRISSCQVLSWSHGHFLSTPRTCDLIIRAKTTAERRNLLWSSLWTVQLGILPTVTSYIRQTWNSYWNIVTWGIICLYVPYMLLLGTVHWTNRIDPSDWNVHTGEMFTNQLLNRPTNKKTYNAHQTDLIQVAYWIRSLYGCL